MSYKVVENYLSGSVHIVADKRSDLNTLPTDYGVGSTCLIIEDSSVWMLGNDKIWHEI